MNNLPYDPLNVDYAAVERERQRRADAGEARARSTIAFLVKSPEGRAYIYDVCDRAGLWSLDFFDHRAMNLAYNVGAMNEARYLWHQIQEHHTDVIALMINENRSRQHG